MSEDRLHVLFVDRDCPSRGRSVAWLEAAGVHVTTADDGISAWTAVRRERPDVVIAEILIDGLDGLALCRALRSDAAADGVRVLIVSVLAARARAAECGADGFLRKPLAEPALIAAVADVVGGLRVAS
jgi:DNA-binding response OmpR family regulator